MIGIITVNMLNGLLLIESMSLRVLYLPMLINVFLLTALLIAVIHIVSLLSMTRRRVDSQQQVKELQRRNMLLYRFIHYSQIYTYIKEVTDSRSIIVEASNNYHEFVNTESREIVGKSMEELFPADFAAQTTVNDMKVVAQGEVLKTEEEYNGRKYLTIKTPLTRGRGI